MSHYVHKARESKGPPSPYQTSSSSVKGLREYQQQASNMPCSYLYDFSSSRMGFKMFVLFVSTMQPFMTISAVAREGGGGGGDRGDGDGVPHTQVCQAHGGLT